ncbi:MAG: hypothetical protein V3U58_07910 [Thermodesulfobacteriota bacterium]
MANGGLSPLSEESIRRLGESALIKRRQFVTQGRTFGPVTAAAFAEGTLRAEAGAKTERDFRLQRIRLEEERIAEERRRTDLAAQEARRARKAAEPSFISTLFGK